MDYNDADIILGKVKPVYCGTCGKKLVHPVTGGWYDEFTGEFTPKHPDEDSLRCPEFGAHVFWHKMYDKHAEPREKRWKRW